MADFEFLENPLIKKWVVLAPRRAKRPDIAKGFEPVCPFCLGRESDEKEVYRVGGNYPDSNWQVRVIPNKFPFAPIHEVIIHSPEHHKNFDELPISQVELIFKTYRQRYNAHKEKGNVYIFHNRGEGGGESLPHPHTQLTVVPLEVKMDIPRLDPSAFSPLETAAPAKLNGETKEKEQVQVLEQMQVHTEYFYLFCPKTSQWPDEVWIAPKTRGRAYGEITDLEISDLANTIQKLIQIFDLRHGHEFPFNFYIYPGGDWYLRLIPRIKTLGGFEVGTGVFVNTQNPDETIEFIKEHFSLSKEPDIEKIKSQHLADYTPYA